MDRFLLESEVRRITAISPVSRWRMEQRGEFPRRRKISPGRVGWLESEVTAWMETRPVSDIEAPGKSTAQGSST
jgi:predicted DNA-binding transcriptional regulator AlpA